MILSLTPFAAERIRCCDRGRGSLVGWDTNESKGRTRVLSTITASADSEEARACLPVGTTIVGTYARDGSDASIRYDVSKESFVAQNATVIVEKHIEKDVRTYRCDARVSLRVLLPANAANENAFRGALLRAVRDVKAALRDRRTTPIVVVDNDDDRYQLFLSHEEEKDDEDEDIAGRTKTKKKKSKTKRKSKKSKKKNKRKKTAKPSIPKKTTAKTTRLRLLVDLAASGHARSAATKLPHLVRRLAT
eukprot:g3470.t1